MPPVTFPSSLLSFTTLYPCSDPPFPSPSLLLFTHAANCLLSRLFSCLSSAITGSTFSDHLDDRFPLPFGIALATLPSEEYFAFLNNEKADIFCRKRRRSALPRSTSKRSGRRIMHMMTSSPRRTWPCRATRIGMRTSWMTSFEASAKRRGPGDQFFSTWRSSRRLSCADPRLQRSKQRLEAESVAFRVIVQQPSQLGSRTVFAGRHIPMLSFSIRML